MDGPDLFIAAVLAWLFGLAGSVSGQPRVPDFTFVVPLQMTSVHPNVRGATVTCTVYASGQIAQHWLYEVAIEQVGRPGNTGTDYIGHGQGQFVPVVNRQVNTTVTVPVMADAERIRVWPGCTGA